MQPDRHIPLRIYAGDDGLLRAEPVERDDAPALAGVPDMRRAALWAAICFPVVSALILGALVVLP